MCSSVCFFMCLKLFFYGKPHVACWALKWFLIYASSFMCFFMCLKRFFSGKPHVICWALKWFLICVSSHRFFLSGECPVARWACKQFFTSVCSFMVFRLLCISITLFFSCVCRPLVTFRACKWFLRFRLLNKGKWLVPSEHADILSPVWVPTWSWSPPLHPNILWHVGQG